MDAEPKALRISTILTIAFVLFGIIAGSFLFVLDHHASHTGGTLAGAELDAVPTRPMNPPAKIDPTTLARITELIPVAVASPAPDVRRTAGEGLLEFGGLAVPSLLNVIHTIVSGENGLELVAARDGLKRADAVLRRLRLGLTPGSPADPLPLDPSPTWLMRRAKSWFVWWDGYVARHPEFE